MNCQWSLRALWSQLFLNVWFYLQRLHIWRIKLNDFVFCVFTAFLKQNCINIQKVLFHFLTFADVGMLDWVFVFTKMIIFFPFLFYITWQITFHETFIQIKTSTKTLIFCFMNIFCLFIVFMMETWSFISNISNIFYCFFLGFWVSL